MGAFSIWHWVIVLVIVLVLFGGRGRISGLMGDLGEGIKSFKKGLADDDSASGNEADKKIADSGNAVSDSDDNDKKSSDS